jgi:hypothetical protein
MNIITPVLAMHGRVGSRVLLLLMAVAALALVLAYWPGKTTSK